MKKIIFITISILLIIISCDKEEIDQKPGNINASDGFYVGCIHLEFEKEENITVQIERREKGTSNWEILDGGNGSSSFDDNMRYLDQGMPPGMIFEYRIKNDMGNNQEYSEIEEGFAFAYVPINEIEISSSVDYKNDIINSLRWNAGNHNSFLNESEIYFNVSRSTDSLGTYQVIAKVGEDRSYTDVIASPITSDKVFYRIDIFYKYKVLNNRGATLWYETAPFHGTIHGVAINSGGNPTVDYVSTDLGTVTSSTQGGIASLVGKNVNGTLYLGLLNDAVSTGYGTMMLFRFNGTSWQKEWSTDPPVEFDETEYAIGSTSSYVAGANVSGVYQWDGSAWSANLTPDNLGQVDSPSELSIDVYNNELYMAIEQHPNYDLQLLKWDGSAKWDTIGGDSNGIIASDAFEIKLENHDGVLYLYYLIDNTLYIKHLNGTSLETDLIWSKENIHDIKIAKNSSDIYFISGSNNPSYRGGVYKITSTSTAEEIISNSTDDWFQFPLSLTIDSENNLIVSSMKIESATSFYPFINIYDGTDWKTISGDFSDGMDPVSISTLGTDIIYVYGDASSESTSGNPTTVKSKKMSK